MQPQEVVKVTSAADQQGLNQSFPIDNTAEIFNKIERLAELHQKGILSEEEYIAKKKELLDRL